MNSSRKIFFILYALAITIFCIFGAVFLWSNTLRPNSDIITIYTANYPIQFLAKEIAGEEVAINNVIPAGQDIDSFAYDEALVETVGMADYYLYMSASESPAQQEFRYELANYNVQAIDIGEGVPYLYSDTYLSANPELINSSTASFETTADIEYDKQAHPENFNPYVWTSPKRLKYMADNIYDFLVHVDQKNKSLYTTNYNALINQINYYDSLYTNGLAQYQGSYLVSNSEAANYIAVDYGLILEEPAKTTATDPTVIINDLIDVGSQAFLYDPNDIYAEYGTKMKNSWKYYFKFNSIEVIPPVDANSDQNLFTYYESNLQAIINTVGA